jgi:hypothetical protein
MNDLFVSHTVIPKSDQLNSDDLLAGPVRFNITGARLVQNPQQPVILSIDQGRQPFKPCLTMRRLLIELWGGNAKLWVGRSLVLFCDKSVTFGKDWRGGIRISHMSHIDGQQSVMLTTARGRKTEFIVKPLNTSTNRG